MTTTDRFGLYRLGPGSKLTDHSHKFGDRDRVTIDRALRLGAEDHHHDGAVPSHTVPAAPGLTLDVSSGSIGAGLRVYYRYTLVDVDGAEGLGSAVSFLDTPAPLNEAAAATLSRSSAGGSLLPGQYFYVLSAYTNVTTQETRAVAPTPITVPAGSVTNIVSLLMPTLPAGATGFNIYRKGPGDARYNFLASTAAGSYTDTGSVEPDCNRTIPVANSTNAANAVTVGIGAEGEAPPAGMTWKLYRTTTGGVWATSFLHHVVEETAEGSGIITPTYQDVGVNPTTGEPPDASEQIGSPSPVMLTDGAEVQGLLPMGRVSGFPFIVTFAFVGSLVGTFQGSTVWVNEFPRASIIGVRAALGRGSAPAAQDDIFDINAGWGANPTMASVFDDPADRPRVEVGDQIGARVPATALTELLVGDCLTADLDQAGGGATPTDVDASINVYMIAHGYEEASFYPGLDLRSPPGLLAWYNEGGFGVLDGQPIPSWANAVTGIVGPAVQATAGLRPIRDDGVLNGRAVALFSGDFLKTAGFAITAQPITVFFVGRSSTLSGAQTYVDGDAGEMQVAKDVFPHFVAGPAGGIVGPVADTGWHIFCAEMKGSTLSTLRVGGGPGAQGAGGVTGLTAITLGSLGFAAANFLVGAMAEVLVYQGARTPQDLNTVGHYLSERFDLPWADVDA